MSDIPKDWCINMAKLEDDGEIGAGSRDHPLRIPANGGYEWYEARFCGGIEMPWRAFESLSFVDAAERYAQDEADGVFEKHGDIAEVSVRKRSDPGHVELFEVSCSIETVFNAARMD